MRLCFASLIVVAVSLHASAVSTTNSNGSVMTPNSELTRNQLVATDVSGLLSSESDPNVVFTNGELLVRGERVKTGPDETEVQEIANAAVETNALTVATTNRVALLETATNNLASSVTGLQSLKADRSTTYTKVETDALLVDKADIDNPIFKGPVLIEGIHPEVGLEYIDIQGSGIFIEKPNEFPHTYLYFPREKNGIIALTSDISAENPTFSNAVLAVGLNIDTNSVAVLNEIASAFGGFPIEGTATTVGGLLAALAAAAAWLKKNKVGSFASVGGATATVDNGVAKLDDFFTKSNSLLTGTIEARLPYPLYAVPSTGILKDRAINTTSLASVTVPDNFTDLLVRASVASSLSVTMPEAIATKYGDTFPGEAGEYLITITKTGTAEAYVRTIKLEVANA